MDSSRQEIIVRAGFNSTALASGMRTAGQQVKHWALEVGTAIAGAFAVEKIFDFEKGLAEFAKSIKLTAERLGVTTDEVQKLSYAAKESGVELDTVAAALDKIAKAKEDALKGDATAMKLRQTFSEFGITIDQIEKFSPQQLFDSIADSVEKTGASSKTTAAAMDLMGAKLGGKLIPLFMHFNELAKETPLISNEDLDMIEKAGNAWEKAGLKLKVLLATMQVRLFQKETYQRFWASFTHWNTEASEIEKLYPYPESPKSNVEAEKITQQVEEDEKLIAAKKRLADVVAKMAVKSAESLEDKRQELIQQQNEIEDQRFYSESAVERIDLQAKFLELKDQERQVNDEIAKQEKEKQEKTQKYLDEYIQLQKRLGDLKNQNTKQGSPTEDTPYLPSLEQLAGGNGFLTGLKKQYGPGGVFDLTQGPLKGTARDLVKSQYELAYDVTHGAGSDQIKADQDKIKGLKDVLAKAGFMSPDQRLEQIDTRLETANYQLNTISKILDASGIKIKSN